MQYVLRYDPKIGKSGALRDWLRDNDAALREHTPEGWRYLGSWFSVRGFGTRAVESRWDIDDYGALGSGWGDDAAQRLTSEWFDFVDQTRPFEATLYKDVNEVSVLPGV